MSSNPAMVKVRAQALGGKYLGPAAGGQPQLTVTLTDGTVLATATINNCSSGTVNPTVNQQEPDESPNPIVVPPLSGANQFYPAAGDYWLLPPSDDSQASATVSLNLTEAAEVVFTVEAFSPFPVTASTSMTIEPGQDVTLDPGVVVSIPGLYVPYCTAQVNTMTGAVDLLASVKMMCGCPISVQPRSDAVPSGTEPYWPSTDFLVTATILLSGLGAMTLQCSATSTFTATVPALPPGIYPVRFSAAQLSNPINVGSGSAILEI